VAFCGSNFCMIILAEFVEGVEAIRRAFRGFWHSLGWPGI